MGASSAEGIGLGFGQPVYNHIVLVKTGVFIEYAEHDECLWILPRSGLAFQHGITVLNAPGLIDADYRDEIGVILINLSDKTYRVKKGDRIAQAVLQRVNRVENIPVSEAVREGGFGSTGK